MPFLTDEEIENRKDSPDNLINRLEVIKIKRGKVEGDIYRHPDSLRKTVAILDIAGIHQKDIGEMLDLRQCEVSRLADGKNSSGGQYKEESNPVKELRGEVKKDRDKAESKAIDVMLEALDILKPQIADIKKPKLLSSIAKDMTFISDRMRPKEERSDSNQVHVHLYSPRIKEVSEYEIIDSPINS